MFTQRARFLAVLSLAVSLCPLGAYAQELSASDVLKKVAETYGHVSSFSVIAGKRVDFDTEGRYIEPNGALMGSRQSDDIQATLMASGSSKAKLLLKDGKKEIVVVCDGKVVWTLIPAQHEYTEVSTSSANIGTPVYNLHVGTNDISGVDLLRAYEFLFAARFQDLSSYGSWAKLEHSETLKVGKVKKECYVVTIQMPGGTQKQKLWVDKAEFIVWKSADTTLGTQGYPAATLETTITVTTEQMARNPSLDESNFVFTPGQAKKVDSLKLSGDNHF
jgi:outer membrane lipoprotein-sorting protein